MVFLPHWPKTAAHQIFGNLKTFLRLLDKLGNPQLNLPPVIHIAGTDGKGSSVAMICNILHEAGYNTHSFTSPHLLECNERINVSGNDIDDGQLFTILEQVRLACVELDIEIGFFKAMCAAAFLAFAQHKADFVVLETGLGGLQDPTNAIPKPALTIITSINYDHQAVLGDSIEEIARAKAGIIKPEVPCVISAQMDEVYPVLFDQCEKMNAPYIAYEYDFISQDQGDSYLFQSQQNTLHYSLPYMPGYHQIINSSTVIAAMGYLNSSLQLNIQVSHITNALLKTEWRGRLSRISTSQHQAVPKDKIFWLDGAHNNSGALAVSEWAKNKLQKPIILILAMTKKRDIKQFIAPFQGITKHIYTVAVKSEADSYSAEAIAQQTKDTIPTTECDDLYEALYYIAAQNDVENVIVTGSLFLISDFYKLLKNQY